MIEKIIQLENNTSINVKYSLEHETAILFIHFSGGTLQMWNGILPIFTDKYSVIAPDIRGHGLSDKPLEGYHVDDMAHDLYLLLRTLEIKKVHIVGSSMGAEIGLSLAASHPEMVSSIICEGALMNEFGEYGLYNGSEEEIEEEKTKQLAKLMERVLPKYPSKSDYIGEVKDTFVEKGMWNDVFISYLESTLVPAEDGGFTSHYMNHVRIEYITKYWDLHFEEYYKKIKCPILFLPSQEESENEKIMSSLRYFSGLIDTYKIEYIKGSMHAFVWMQYPVRAAELVKVFIEEVENTYLLT